MYDRFKATAEAFEKREREKEAAQREERARKAEAERQAKEAARREVEAEEIARLGVNGELFALLKDHLPGYRSDLAKQVEDRVGLKPEESKPSLGTEEYAMRKMFAEHPSVHEGIAEARRAVPDEMVRDIAREQRGGRGF
jgi:hypothetical protein